MAIKKISDLTEVAQATTNDKIIINTPDGNGGYVTRQVPLTGLPSYVDDIIEGYYYNETFYEDAQHTIGIIPEKGKIYVDLESNYTYRWSDSMYVQVGGEEQVQSDWNQYNDEAVDYVKNRPVYEDKIPIEGANVPVNIVNGIEFNKSGIATYNEDTGYLTFFAFDSPDVSSLSSCLYHYENCDDQYLLYLSKSNVSGIYVCGSISTEIFSELGSDITLSDILHFDSEEDVSLYNVEYDRGILFNAPIFGEVSTIQEHIPYDSTNNCFGNYSVYEYYKGLGEAPTDSAVCVIVEQDAKSEISTLLVLYYAPQYFEEYGSLYLSMSCNETEQYSSLISLIGNGYVQLVSSNILSDSSLLNNAGTVTLQLGNEIHTASIMPATEMSTYLETATIIGNPAFSSLLVPQLESFFGKITFDTLEDNGEDFGTLILVDSIKHCPYMFGLKCKMNEPPVEGQEMYAQMVLQDVYDVNILKLPSRLVEKRPINLFEDSNTTIYIGNGGIGEFCSFFEYSNWDLSDNTFSPTFSIDVRDNYAVIQMYRISAKDYPGIKQIMRGCPNTDTQLSLQFTIDGTDYSYPNLLTTKSSNCQYSLDDEDVKVIIGSLEVDDEGNIVFSEDNQFVLEITNCHDNFNDYVRQGMINIHAYVGLDYLSNFPEQWTEIEAVEVSIDKRVGDKVYAPISSVYIDDIVNNDISTQADWNELDEFSVNYIKNKPEIKTYQPFPNETGTITASTLAELKTAVMSFWDKAQGKAYLGEVTGNCLPTGVGNAEVTVCFNTNNIAVLTCYSSNVAPYHWELNTAENPLVWRPMNFPVDTSISTTSTNPVQNKVIEKYLEPVLGVPADPSIVTNNYVINNYNNKPLNLSDHNDGIWFSYFTQNEQGYPYYVEVCAYPSRGNLDGVEIYCGFGNNPVANKNGICIAFNNKTASVKYAKFMTYAYDGKTGELLTSSNKVNLFTTGAPIADGEREIAANNYCFVGFSYQHPILSYTSNTYEVLAYANGLDYNDEILQGTFTLKGYSYTFPTQTHINYTINGSAPATPWEDLQERVTTLENNVPVIDTEMSASSTNAVQNSTITNYLSPVLGTPVDPTAETVNFVTSTGNPPPIYDFDTDGYPNKMVLAYKRFGNNNLYVELGFKFNAGSQQDFNGLELSFGGAFAGSSNGYFPTLYIRATDSSSHTLDISGTIKAYNADGTAIDGTGASAGLVKDFVYSGTVTNSSWTSFISIASMVGGDISYNLYNNSGIRVMKYFPDLSSATVPVVNYTYDNVVTEWGANFTWNGTPALNPWQQINNRVSNLEIGQVIRTYLDTNTNELYVTTDGSDPTPVPVSP